MVRSPWALQCGALRNLIAERKGGISLQKGKGKPRLRGEWEPHEVPTGSVGEAFHKPWGASVHRGYVEARLFNTPELS